MKKIVIIIGLLISLVLLGWMVLDEGNITSVDMLPTKIEFDRIELDMGSIQHEKPHAAVFKFRNSGEHVLIIQHVEASCGCTQPEWPKHPIKPGQSGEIKVTYDAKYPGRFVKSLRVFCNSDSGMVDLLITGDVLD